MRSKVHCHFIIIIIKTGKDNVITQLNCLYHFANFLCLPIDCKFENDPKIKDQKVLLIAHLRWAIY